MGICSNCGQQNYDGAVSCSRCGASFVNQNMYMNNNQPNYNRQGYNPVGYGSSGYNPVGYGSSVGYNQGYNNMNFQNNMAYQQMLLENESSALPVTALVLAFLFPFVGFILGIIGVAKSRKQSNKNMSVAAIVLSIVVPVLLFIFFFALAASGMYYYY